MSVCVCVCLWVNICTYISYRVEIAVSTPCMVTTWLADTARHFAIKLARAPLSLSFCSHHMQAEALPEFPFNLSRKVFL